MDENIVKRLNGEILGGLSSACRAQQSMHGARAFIAPNWTLIFVAIAVYQITAKIAITTRWITQPFGL